VDSNTSRIIAGPDCISRGAVLTSEEEHVYDEAKERVTRYLEDLPEQSGRDWDAIRQDIRRTVNKLLQQKTGRRPMVVPVIMRI
jgi:ribonuclease J